MLSFFRKRTKQPVWNKEKLVGQKPPLKMQDVWAIRTRLHMTDSRRDLALFNLAIDWKLRGCDLVRLKVRDVTSHNSVSKRASIVQQKTGKAVQFEITPHSRRAISDWIKRANLEPSDYLFPSQVSAHLSTRQYARLLSHWLDDVGLDCRLYGTHSLRRTKVALIYRRTKNLRAVQLLLGHTKLESTVRYLGIELDDALELSEKIDI